MKKHVRTQILDAAVVSLVAIVALVSGCATPMFTVNSEPPNAEVFYQAPGTTEKKQIGKTPFSMPMNDFRTIVGTDVTSGQYFPITVEKPGFQTQTFNLPSTKFGTYVTALDVKLKEGVTAKEEYTAKMLLDKLFVAQKFALSTQFERAQAELDSILRDHPKFARALSMRASIYYAQKNMNDALKWYEEALKADPQFEDAQKMITKIRGGGALTKTDAVAQDGVAAARAPASAPKAKKGKK